MKKAACSRLCVDLGKGQIVGIISRSGKFVNIEPFLILSCLSLVIL